MSDTRANKRFRSQEWFDNPNNPGMTALYVERYQNSTFSREELQSERPIIGIAQTGSDLAPCNKIHVFLMERIKQGIREPSLRIIPPITASFGSFNSPMVF